MLEQFFKEPETVQRLRGESLGPYLDSFAALLSGFDYANATVRGKIYHLTDFSHWLDENELIVDDLDEPVVGAFISDKRRQGCLWRGQPSTVRLLLDHLCDEGVIPSTEPVPACEESPLAQLESRYEKYLKEERGLVQATVDGYQPFVRRFLIERFEDGPLLLRELVPPDISSFVLRNAHSMSPGRAKLMVTSLRSFFSFLLQHGEIEANLAGSVPTVRSWRLSSIPKYLTPEEVEHLLDACDATGAPPTVGAITRSFFCLPGLVSVQARLWPWSLTTSIGGLGRSWSEGRVLFTIGCPSFPT